MKHLLHIPVMQFGRAHTGGRKDGDCPGDRHRKWGFGAQSPACGISSVLDWTSFFDLHHPLSNLTSLEAALEGSSAAGFQEPQCGS